MPLILLGDGAFPFHNWMMNHIPKLSLKLSRNISIIGLVEHAWLQRGHLASLKVAGECFIGNVRVQQIS